MTAPKVLVPHQVDGGIAADLRTEIETLLPDVPVQTTGTPEETETVVDDAAVVVTYSFDPAWVDRAGSLEWIQALSAGVDGYDREHVAARDVILTSSAGVHAEPMAQHVLGYVLCFERGLLRGIHDAMRREWNREWVEEVGDKTVGIVGVGAIGSRVAERLRAFDATVIGTKRDPTTGGDVVDEIYGPDGLDRLVERADYLVLTCPLTEETRGLLGAAEFEAMRDSAVLVNVARGEIVDEDALVAALRDGALRGAALDAFAEEPLPEESPLWGFEEVIVTPHTAGTSQFLNRRKAELFAANYERFRAGDLDAIENRVV